MALAYNEEQRALIETAKDFSQKKSPIADFRKNREALLTDKDFSSQSFIGYDKSLWAETVELGWAGMPFPEAYGGFEFGFMGLAGCMTELGHTLHASPLLSNVVLAGATILFSGSEKQKETLLPQIAAGETLFAVAVDEAHHHDPSHIETTAKKTGDGFILNGQKKFVIDGHSADQLIVVARTSESVDSKEGISLFLVDAKLAGVTIERVNLLDSRSYAHIKLKDVKVSAEQLLGTIDEGFSGLDQALDHARVCLAAEMLGGMEEIFNRTVEYLKERKQFGALIGSFQGLQHRAAHMYTQIEICKSALMSALDAMDSLDKENKQAGFSALASAAKALITETYELVSNEAVQMHGGIGVTDELDIGLFLKRARVSAELLGNASFHYQRYASLNNY